MDIDKAADQPLPGMVNDPKSNEVNTSGTIQQPTVSSQPATVFTPLMSRPAPVTSATMNNTQNIPSLTQEAGSDEPIAVVKVLSTRGVEYAFMSISLWIAAASLISLLIGLSGGNVSFEVLALPIAIMLVTAPIFAFFFLRLKKQEQADPRLRFDPSKRRLSQITQIVSFLACVINLISFVYLVLKTIGGAETDLLQSFINLLIIMVVAGGILVYYWFDEHRKRG